MPHTHYAAHSMHSGAKNTNKSRRNNKKYNSNNSRNSSFNKSNEFDATSKNVSKNKNISKNVGRNAAKNVAKNANSIAVKNVNKESRKNAKKRNPFEYKANNKANNKNYELNSRKSRNRKADKLRERLREKALQYEEMAIREAEQDFANKSSLEPLDSSKSSLHNSKSSSDRNKSLSRKSLSRKSSDSSRRSFDNHNNSSVNPKKNSVIIPDCAIESRESYKDDVTFEQLGVPSSIVDVLRADGKINAFPIQQATLPDSLKGKNILGRGRTGSGKTLAFAIPLVSRLAENFVDLINSDKKSKNRKNEDLPSPRALILAPTRELVHQIDDVVAPLAAAYGMRTVTVYGGVRYQRQISQLKQGAQIVLACPGRLEDLLRQGALSLEKVIVSVLDEADEMADMGFLPAVTRLLEQVKPDGQRMLFSATLDKQVATLVNKFLPNAVVHALDDADSQVDTMTHHVFAVSSGDKYEVLRKLASGKKRSIFFTRTKCQAKNMAKKFVQQGIPAVDLQGNLSQSQRDRHLAVFAQGLVRVLVATDVAARGIDISDVALVVQTEPPEDPKSFLHRSGRTARAGEEGDVVTLVLPNQKRSAHIMLRRSGIHAQTQDVNQSSPILDEIVGDAAQLQEGWSMPEPSQNKRKSRGGRSHGRGRYRGRMHERSHSKSEGNE